MIIHISRARIIKYTTICIITMTLWLIIAFFVTHHVEDSTEGQVITTFKFLAPMKPSAANNLVIKRADTGKQVSYEYQWITANTLKVLIYEKSYPRGHQYTYKFKAAPVMIWPFHVWASGDFFSRVKLRFLGIKNSDAVPSRGPILLQFNTFVDPLEIQNFVKFPIPGKLEPLKFNLDTKKPYTDYSQWQYLPSKKLNNQTTYPIIIRKGLPSINRSPLEQSLETQFKTTSEFLITQVYPHPGSRSVWLTRNITIQTNQKLKNCKINVEGLHGDPIINQNVVQFSPHRVMMPDKLYKVNAQLISTSNERLDYEFFFTTTNLGNTRWLELKLGSNPSLWLVEGNNTIKQIQVSLKSPSIPKGTLYEQNRNKGTTNSPGWIHLNADILFHAVPTSVKDDHRLLGLPTTYNCIYFSDQDINELTTTLPKDFMLICH